MTELSQFIQYLGKEKEAHLSEANRLAKDNMQDEATMARIRANMFEIMTQISRAAEKHTTPQSTFHFIKERIAQIPTEWKKSLAAAEQHGDHTKVAIEHIKLNTMAEIERELNNIFGGVS